jgi:hypothetical protein
VSDGFGLGVAGRPVPVAVGQVSHGEYRHLGGTGHLLGDAADEVAVEAGAAVRAHRDRVDLVVGGVLDDLLV